MTAREFRKKHFPCSEDKTHLDLYSHTFEQKLNEFAKIKCQEQRVICKDEYQFDCNDRVIPYDQKQLDVILNAPYPQEETK